MDIIDWILLKTLQKKKNITETAKEMMISQPAISYRIKQLEEQFKVKIIYRGSRGVSFTTEGEYIANFAVQFITAFSNLEEEVLNLDNKIQGVLRIAASSIFSRYKLPSLLREFNLEYPLVEFEVTTGWSEVVTNLITRDDAHLGIVRGDHSIPSSKVKIMSENIYIVSKDEIKVKNLPQLPRIYYNTDTSLKKLIDEWWYSKFHRAPSNSMLVDNMETCKEMVKNGLGYAILPSILLNNEDSLYKVKCISAGGEELTRDTWIYYKEEYLDNPIIKAFIDFTIHK